MTKIFQQDVLQWCKEYEGEKFHALLCDPPYHLSGGFMGKKWDKDGPDAIAFNPKTWEALAEHLLPGAFGMAFASSRGWHRLACAIEDAGLIIHPTIFGWSFGSGFPKATRIDKRIDESVSANRESVEYDRYKDGRKRNGQTDGKSIFDGRNGNLKSLPATELAKAWASYRYGLQALKPALEPIFVFQKPYAGKPLESITKTGAGALDIDGARISGTVTTNSLVGNAPGYNSHGLANQSNPPNNIFSEGRWPANFVLVHSPSCNGECVPECPVRRLGEQSGELKSGVMKAGTKIKGNRTVYQDHGYTTIEQSIGDTGTAARFFFNADWNAEVEERLFEADPVRYQAKASRSERDAGLDEMPLRNGEDLSGGGGINHPKADAYQARKTNRHNAHPTVKPIKLVGWLAKLLFPPEMYAPRRILIPFSGSGSEMIGAHKAGWEEIIGIEQEAEYVKIAEARIAHHCEKQGEHKKSKVKNVDLFDERSS